MLLIGGVGEDSWVPWTARRSNQCILKETSTECSLERHAEAEIPILWPPDAKNWLIRKYPFVGKDWRQEEKGTTEDEIVEWHHWQDRHEFEQPPGVWWTGKTGVLQSMGVTKNQRNWATELNWVSNVNFILLFSLKTNFSFSHFSNNWEFGVKF